MPDIFGQPTASEAIAAVKNNRVISDARVSKSGVPSNEKAGKVAVVSHVVTTAEDTANSLTESFPDFEIIETVSVQLRSTAGLIKTATPTITITGSNVTVADTTMIATDIFTITVKGKKV